MRVNTVGFVRALNQLSIRSGKTAQQVLRHEATKVVEGAIRRTTAAKASRIKKSEEAYVLSKKHNGATRYNGKIYLFKNRYSDEVWNHVIMESVRRKTARAIARRGMARAAFYRPATVFGMKVKSTPEQKKLKLKYARYAAAGSKVTEGGTGKDFYIQIKNAYAKASYAKSAVALYSSINARASFFSRTLKNFLNGDLKAWARSYPGIFVK